MTSMHHFLSALCCVHLKLQLCKATQFVGQSTHLSTYVTNQDCRLETTFNNHWLIPQVHHVHRHCAALFLIFPWPHLPLRSRCLFVPGAEVREVDLKLITGGIVHTKLWVVDQKHLYLGSANMDWRSLSQVNRNSRNLLFSCIGGGAGRVGVITLTPCLWRKYTDRSKWATMRQQFSVSGWWCTPQWNRRSK